MNKHKATGHVENLNKNLRYKIWKSDEGIFLVDLQKNILSYLFPSGQAWQYFFHQY
ncbi:hypothetical protein MUA52_07300 [Staphylococcus agnetis]|uniref:Transposase n=1 Tax=Staphylococcus agnetis TaxID=985762 RepID=A0ABD7TTN8_9STAP|nr:hypothetical protein [Staphylococcus agnetis]UXU54069.1 hypothetical protein MUA11_07015 [Staphylococcus agnetis]UXU56322.1 hypothetical protein MUA95_07015 [Staphylococcus agnetis]UXU63297.1 hypothetical protein MUA84_07060 [Staphylococcus agnetis]UXU65636.1 hypothetical protein MUA52_07300 [Staphylococcus agnetis]